MTSNIVINKKKTINIAILILCFDRPDLLKKLLKILKYFNAKKIYISQDGYDGNNYEIKKRHTEVKILIKKINWTKTLKTNYFKKNLGKQVAPPKGIDWFYKNVKKGIILEDDTLPSKSFFSYCDILLKKHQKDKKIFQICGTGTLNKGFGNITYISSVPWMHGWATWRNRWKNYSYKIKNLKKLSKNKNFKKNVPFFFGRLYWLSLFKNFTLGKHKTWDYTIVNDCLTKNLGCLKPSFNMITNIGYKNKNVLSKRKRVEVKEFEHLKNRNNNYFLEKSFECWILYNLSIRYRLTLFLKYILKLI